MMMRISARLILLLLTLVSCNVVANCKIVSKYQTIEIIADANGKPFMVAKADSEQCEVTNNGHQNTTKTSHLKWVFRGLDCKANNCRIEFHGGVLLLAEAYKCNSNNANYHICMLQVHKAKAYCDQHNPHSPTCTIHYDIWVGNTKVDPSIIIRPRPY